MAHEIGETVNQTQEIGRLVTLGAIGSVVADILLMILAGTATSVSPYMGFLYLLLIILLCGQLYIGSNWARWFAGIVLIFIGGIWSYEAIMHTATSVTPFRIAVVAVAIASLGFGFALLISKSVKHFLLLQKSNRSQLPLRILKALWSVAVIWVAVLIAIDLVRLFS